MIFDLFSYFKKKETALLIDVGNGTITGSLVSFTKNQLPNFLYSVTSPFTVEEKASASGLFLGMNTLLDSILSTTVKQGAKIDRVLVSFSSPWFIIKTKDIHITNDKSFSITEKFLNDITNKEQDLFIEELSKDSTSGSQDYFKVIETSVVNTKVDGKIADNVVGKNTKDFEANVFMSAISKNTADKVVDTISKHTHIPVDKISMHTFPLVLLSAVRDNFAIDKDFVLMDVTSEITDLTLVTDDVITKTESFPFGRNYIIREIAKTFNVSLQVAESQLHMYMDRKVGDDTNIPMHHLMESLEKEWATHFEDTLLALSPGMIFPRSLYITAGSDVTPIFIEFLKLPKADKTSIYRKELEITNLNKENLSRFYTNDSKKQEDEFVTILSIFCNKLLFL